MKKILGSLGGVFGVTFLFGYGLLFILVFAMKAKLK
jgi:hypothetical protein